MGQIILDCILPSSQQVRCLDRFSILDDDAEGEDGLVPFWLLLQNILTEKRNSPSGILEVLDTIWLNIVQTVLELPKHFPRGNIKSLNPGDCLRLSGTFLCTLSAPSWRDGFYGFIVWYSSSQRHPKAVKMYITALFVYFERLHTLDAISDSQQIEYSLHALGSDNIPTTKPWNEIPLRQAAVVNVPNYSTLQQEFACQGSNGAVVVSANKDIGFGQSATQEEIYVGNCPEACPAILVTPTLGPAQVLVITGARPILRIVGQRRAISWSILEPSPKGGRMLFKDVPEMDDIDENDGLLPDLKPKNPKRENLKAYTAFSAWESGEGATVWSGIWGCGVFNGDPGVKMCSLWIAASLAGKELRILCDPSQGEFSTSFERAICQFGRGSTVAELKNRLDSIPKWTTRLETVKF
ncbi:hypothetical protein J3458_020876 [Metarhizium acridum]|uniref:uncharacterized protein n=1 Tax=Metarhizium acridum TaxID=92637 RepID=UPI001C6B722C|nr:hypothetical protein J3458_020876 [Metarhizium acridum]